MTPPLGPRLKPTSLDLIHAYRHLYRGLLHAVQYSRPGRFTARDMLRDGFRKGDPSTFNQEKIDNTVQFLRAAARERGLEHRLVKNLTHIAYDQKSQWNNWKRTERTPMAIELKENHMIHYKMTIAMLNDSMGLCLP